MKSFVQQFEIGPTKTQVSVVTFSTGVKSHFWLNDHTTKNDLLNAISNVHYASGITNTDKALQFARQNSLLPSNGARHDAERIVIVLTDGQSTNPSMTKQQADLLHQAGVEVYFDI